MLRTAISHETTTASSRIPKARDHEARDNGAQEDEVAAPHLPFSRTWCSQGLDSPLSDMMMVLPTVAPPRPSRHSRGLIRSEAVYRQAGITLPVQTCRTCRTTVLRRTTVLPGRNIPPEHRVSPGCLTTHHGYTLRVVPLAPGARRRGLWGNRRRDEACTSMDSLMYPCTAPRGLRRR